MIWHELASPQVRDLAWSCFSADLLDINLVCQNNGITAFNPTLTTERRRWLKALDAKPAPLLEYLSTGNTGRLGLYFEKLWQYFLLTDQEFKLCSHNLPVQIKGKTFGEFDIIYYNYTERHHVHLELALKYYLGVPLFNNQTTSHCSQWIGISGKDNLDLKLYRLLNHQIRLSKNPQGQHALEQLGVESLDHQIALKGYLFNSTAEPLAPPQYLGRAAHMHGWQRWQDFESTLRVTKHPYWLNLPKSDWLSDCHNKQNTNLMSAKELGAHLTQHFRNSQRPLMVSAVNDNHFLMEHTRSFVTPDNWPSCNFPKLKY